MRLSSSDLEILRSRPSSTKLDLFIFQPREVMRCKINSPLIAKGARTIEYDTVSLGSYASVESGMTLLIGSEAGKGDIGRIRIKSASDTSFSVSENSNIRWADELHLTVLRYFEVWPVFPRIIQNPSNPTNVIFYKDYDIPYTNQNSILGTIVNMGTHRPIFLENGTGTAYYSSTGSLNLLGESFSYDWAFEGGTPTGSTQANPGYVNYTTPGDYVTRLIATSASGAIDTSYRYVSVKNKIGEGSTTPVVRWEMKELSGSRNEGGYSAEFRVFDQIDIDENAVVMLLADDWYGGSNVSLGGNYPNNSKVFFVGYIENGSLAYNHQYSYFSFRASSVTSIMKKFTGFSASIESSINPGTWFELLDMDVRRAVYHYLKWHTTVLKTSDFNFIGEDYKIQYFDVDRTSLYDAIDSIMKGALAGSLASDRQGILWAETDPMAYADPTGTFVPVMEISKRDWMGEPQITERINDDTSYLEYGGVAYSGVVTGTYGAFLSGAPGVAPSFSGNVEQYSGLALTGQVHLNQVTGHIWANKNQEYPTVSMEMANNVRNLDIAPQEVVYLKVQPEDTVQNIAIDGVYIPSSIVMRYDSAKAMLTSSIEFTGLVNGVPGDTIEIPNIAYNFDDDFGFDSFPPFPPFVPPLIITDPLSTDYVVLLLKDYGVYYTNDFTSESPSWYPTALGLPSVNNLSTIELSNIGRIYTQVGSSAIYSSEFLGGEWVKIFDTDDIGNPEGFGFPRDPVILGFGVDRNDPDHILIIAGLTVTIGGSFVVYAFSGTAGNITLVQATPALTVTVDFDSGLGKSAFLTLGGTQWVMTYMGYGGVTAVTMPYSGTQGDNLTVLNLGGSILNTRSRKSVNAVIARAAPNLSTTNGGSWSEISGTPSPYAEGLNAFQSIITNEDGTQIVMGQSSPAGFVYSNDTGATWITGTFPGRVTSVWHLGEDVYVFSGENKVYAIQGLDTTPVITDKTGNLMNIITGAFSTVAIRSYQ